MKTEILKIKDSEELGEIKHIAQMLQEGKLVAIPTETVYGIGCRAKTKAIKQLNQLKGRHPDKRYTLHVGSLSQLLEYVPAMSPRVKKLVENALPGPLTVVFEVDKSFVEKQTEKLGSEVADFLYRDGTIGIRFPDNPVTCAILASADCPVVAPSANPAGQDPAVNSEKVKDYFDGQIEAIVNSPQFPCHYKQSSTVVKITKKEIQILRQGAISEQQLRRLTTVCVLFVCTGNTCRSPMAEAIARKHFANILGCSVDELADFGYKVSSAGVAAMPGMPASPEAVRVCSENGSSLTLHQSALLSAQDVTDSDYIFVMSQGHLHSILTYFPQAKDKCCLLDEQGDIADPIGQTLQVYQQCYEQMEKAISHRASEIL